MKEVKERRKEMAKEKILGIERFFTRDGEDVYKETKWTKQDVQIVDDENRPLFLQKNVEAPEWYSNLARKIIASRYFYGDKGNAERESSVRQLVGRVCETIANWGLKDGYFDKNGRDIFEQELAKLCIGQYGAFNSPVWFNVGTDRYESRKTKDQREEYTFNDKDRNIIINGETKFCRKGEIIKIPVEELHLYPQTSACFIQYVDDTMEDIMNLAKQEASIFRHGSGTGTDLSTLRSSREKLSGGGKPSGPLAYFKFYDNVAGIVKSGGKTRRAAKMDSLKISHPDIKEFIQAKSEEEDKIRMLVAAGLPVNKAKETVSYQNSNLSVRVTDEFINAIKNDEDWKTIAVHNKELSSEMPVYKARELFNLIAEGTHKCGDPGIQYDTTINKWHTCPNSGRINASNPCSEYMFLDDSSCNLASLNLMTFITPEGKFDVNSFKRAVRILAIAQDLLYDNSSFPTREIAENSHRFRPLGMGYANLGALLMFLGFPYDSDEGRTIASSVTSLMTSTVYQTSKEMAKNLGTFEEFEKNREPMLKVIGMHRQASRELTKNSEAVSKKISFNIEEILDNANKNWDENVKDDYGFRNAQATVLAPTGTIGFMMDCATTGIEPDIALVKYKLLAEGGTLKIINYTVGPALERLGYSENKVKSIVDYIEKNDTIEGSELKEEHLPIFDCAFKPKKGKRNISPIGHIKMMAAVQPFLSGAISKTVNMDEKTTVEEIKNIYLEAWKLGLKATAIYRDRSKVEQPLSTSKDNLEAKLNTGKPFRRKLPTTRHSITHKFNVAGHEGYLTVGLYEDSTPGELFIIMSKEGSTIGGLMDTIGTLTSFALQYGIPLKDLANKLRNNRFEPYGIVLEGDEDKNIKFARSLTDYIYTWLAKQFNCDTKPNPIAYDDERFAETEGTGNQDKKLSKIAEDNPNSNKLLETSGEPGGFCIKCGRQMYKFGYCEERCISESCQYVEYSGCGK